MKIDKNFSAFVAGHIDDDVPRLVLARDKWPGIDVILAADTILGRRAMKEKMPLWYARPDMIYPDRLCTEQCSSQKTAALKAGIAKRLAPEGRHPRIADLTAGIGADSFAFSYVAERVLHNERNAALSDAAKANFGLLGIHNVVFTSYSADKASLGCGGDLRSTLDCFGPDILFLDPSRRDSTGSKVFLITDCSPDITDIRHELLSIAPAVMVKFSPMLDISSCLSSLDNVAEIHTVGADGECKELLVILIRNFNGEPALIVHNEDCSDTFPVKDSAADSASLPVDLSCLAGKWLLEPCKSLSKSGLFNLAAEKYGITKLGINTHLYATDTPERLPEKSRGLFKCLKILQIIPFGRQAVRTLASQYPVHDVTARNFPLSSEELSSRLKREAGKAATPKADSGRVHIYGVHIDFRNAPSGNYLLVTGK